MPEKIALVLAPVHFPDESPHMRWPEAAASTTPQWVGRGACRQQTCFVCRDPHGRQVAKRWRLLCLGASCLVKSSWYLVSPFAAYGPLRNRPLKHSSRPGFLDDVGVERTHFRNGIPVIYVLGTSSEHAQRGRHLPARAYSWHTCETGSARATREPFSPSSSQNRPFPSRLVQRSK